MKTQRQLYYGADYNPEQWSKEVILEDMRLMKEAGVNYVSINIFGWVNLQPDESTYDFDFLDWLMDLLYGKQYHDRTSQWNGFASRLACSKTP